MRVFLAAVCLLSLLSAALAQNPKFLILILPTAVAPSPGVRIIDTGDIRVTAGGDTRVTQ